MCLLIRYNWIKVPWVWRGIWTRLNWFKVILHVRGGCILHLSLWYDFKTILSENFTSHLKWQEKQNLADIIQMHHQMKARQISVQSDANSFATYPEYIIPYLVHTFAHHLCPDIDECKDVKAFELVYRYEFRCLECTFMSYYTLISC